MFKSGKGASQPWRILTKQIQKPVIGLLLFAGITASSQGLAARSNAAEPVRSIADGIYLYGQSPEPQKIGSEYLVFEVNQGQVVGGFYMPRSSFDCFYGNVEADKLALTIVDSYERTAHPYAVALQPDDSVAMAGGQTLAPMGLAGYHRIATLGPIDHQVLTTCKADHNNPSRSGSAAAD